MHTPQTIQQAIESASRHESKLSADVLTMEGMSSPKVRHLLNNLCAMPGTRYAEIGVWNGATFCAALDQNEAIGFACDNWSQFGGMRSAFIANCDRVAKGRWEFAEDDCFSPRVQVPKRTSIYVYDGCHDWKSQYRNLAKFSVCFADTCVVLVDDYNEADTKSATESWICDNAITFDVLFEVALPARFNGDFEGWWNGVFVMLLARR